VLCHAISTAPCGRAWYSQINVEIDVVAPVSDVWAGNCEVLQILDIGGWKPPARKQLTYNKKDAVEFNSWVVVGNTPKEVFNEVIISVDAKGEVKEIGEDEEGNTEEMSVELIKGGAGTIFEVVVDLGGSEKEVTIPVVVSSSVVVVVVKVRGNVMEELEEVFGIEIVEASNCETKLSEHPIYLKARNFVPSFFSRH